MTFKVGDTVRYTAAWLRSTDQIVGGSAFRRGVVTGLKTFRRVPGVWPYVQWDGEAEGRLVHPKNVERAQGGVACSS